MLSSGHEKGHGDSLSCILTNATAYYALGPACVKRPGRWFGTRGVRLP